MDVARTYRIIGFIAALVSYVSFFLSVYLFLLGFDAAFLQYIYLVGIIVLVCWSIAPLVARQVPTKTRIHLFILLVCILSMTVVYLGEDATRVFFLRVALLTPKTSSTHVPDWSPILVAALYVVAFLGITFVLKQKSTTSSDSLRNVVYVCTISALAFAPQLMFQNRAVDLMEHWYQFMLDVHAGEKAPRTDVVVLTVQTDQIVSDRLETLLRIVDESSPRIVALVSDDFYGKVRVSRARVGERLVMIRQPSVTINPWDPWSPYARNTLDHGSYFYSTSRFSVYYRATNADVGLKTVLHRIASPGDSASVRRSSNEILIQSIRIPLIDRERSVIKYYDRRSIPNFYYTEWFESDTLEAYLHLFTPPSGRSLRVNHRLGRLESYGVGQSVDSREKATVIPATVSRAIPELRDKIVLVDYYPLSKNWERSFGDGFMYANIVQNILEQDFLNEPDRPVYIISSIMVIVSLALLFLKRPLWQAVLIVLVGGAIGCGIFMGVFFSFSILINPYPLLIFAGGGIVLFMPALFVWERKALFEERSRLNAELRTAHDMQLGLMPKQNPVVAGFDISGICLPANEVGGDFFDYVWLDQKKTKLGIAVADVSGKAMKAAITAVMTSGMLYRELGENGTPKTILRKINRPMYTKLDSRTFTALSLAVIDTKKKELRFSNAGQTYPVLKRGEEVLPLEVKGARLPLGVKEDVLYKEMIVKLKKGETVIFYTDGIPEAKNEKDEFYGFDRFRTFVEGLGALSAGEMRDRILNDVNAFTGRAPQHDDMTVVVVRVTS